MCGCRVLGVNPVAAQQAGQHYCGLGVLPFLLTPPGVLGTAVQTAVVWLLQISQSTWIKQTGCGPGQACLIAHRSFRAHYQAVAGRCTLKILGTPEHPAQRVDA